MNEHFRLLDFTDIDQVYAELKDVKFVIEAKLHNARCCVYKSLSVQVLSGKIEKVIRADLQLQRLDIVMDDF